MNSRIETTAQSVLLTLTAFSFSAKEVSATAGPGENGSTLTSAVLPRHAATHEIFSVRCDLKGNVEMQLLSKTPQQPITVVIPPQVDTTYTVKSGDSYSKIAARPEIYNDSRKWSLIAEANGIAADKLKPGMDLKIPNLAYEEACKLELKLTNLPTHHVLEPGESIFSVSAKAYNDAARWPIIVALNPEIQSFCPGQGQLRIRPDYGSAILCDGSHLNLFLNRAISPVYCKENAPNDVRQFVEKYADSARRIEQRYGIPAMLCLAQAMLESEYGKSAPGNNFFGMKAPKHWQGETQTLKTSEYENGVKVRVSATFCAYSSFEESLSHWAEKLCQSPYYRGVVANFLNLDSCVQALHQSPYATDPKYDQKIHRMLAYLTHDPSVVSTKKDQEIPAGCFAYKIKDGDNFSKLAKEFLGNGKLYGQIESVNPGVTKLTIGQVVFIPNKKS
ncbi:MAG: glucosaminidase domain-containing protein [bacterium]|nr:glucosaminidase domain-containing protein [bacterium]